jgi:hypothetical protein
LVRCRLKVKPARRGIVGRDTTSGKAPNPTASWNLSVAAGERTPLRDRLRYANET